MSSADHTAERILRAAQRAFSTHGYAATGMREITREAGVSVALANRYFGTKEKLFEAALAPLLNASLLTGQPRERFGASLVAIFASTGQDAANPLPMLVLATADAGARAIADRLLRDLVMSPLAAWFDRPNADERAARLVMLASGFFVYRLLYPLEAVSGAIAPATRAWLERGFQSIVDDPA
jgi:AcrR family transcriptional regulator